MEEATDGSWLIAQYAPVSLFSLKASFATSSVGTTLVVPTPYAVKMALVDAAFRAGWPETECGDLLKALVPVTVRLAPPEAVVTHTFNKIRQEPKKASPETPYISNVAYREFASHHGTWQWAFQLTEEDPLQGRLRQLLPLVRYIGKRGSFIQYLTCGQATDLGSEFTQPLGGGGSLALPGRSHIVPLDDFGPEATLEVLSSFSSAKVKRERHRRWEETIVPLGRVRTGAGFTEYRR